MADFPDLAPAHSLFEHQWALSTVSPDGILSGAGAASAAWPSANLAIYVPVRLSKPATVYKAVIGCGATGGGNFDVGIFAWGGAKLVSTGSTARAASNEIITDVTDTYLPAGRYWIGMSADGTSNYIVFWSALNAGLGKMAGLRQQATAFALPSTATFATSAQSLFPAASFLLRSES